MVREAGRGVEVVRCSMKEALRRAMAALQAGHFAAARDTAAPFEAEPGGALLHALARAGAGDVAGGATAMASIARANPAAQHPVQDLLGILRQHGRGREAASHVRAALEFAPGDPALWGLLGAALAETGPMAEAVDAFREAARLAPGQAAAWSNLAKALAAEGRFGEADAAFATAAARAPGDAQLRLNRAVATLKSGRWDEGWPMFRARHALPGRAPPLPGAELTRLDAVAGRTVLLVHDEGFGDTLQFIRYAPLLMERGATVLAWVPPPLVRLLQGMPGLHVVTGAPPQYDFWCRIPDLPGVFGTVPGTVPAGMPYLSSDPALAAAWARRLPVGRRVGLVWAGAARAHDAAAAATDRVRSIAADGLGPLLAVPGVCWISLQQGRPAPPGVFDPMPGVVDFADTAAIVAGLEAVVSVDTAVAHLAAAMGKTVLLLDRHDNCWRWLSGRRDSPWYPGVLHIMRQTGPGDWDGVLREAATWLEQAMV